MCLGPWPSPSDTHLTGCLFLLVFSHWCAAIRQSAAFAGGAGGRKIYADTTYAIMKTEDKTPGYHTNWCIFPGRLFAWSSNSCHAPASLIWAPLPLQHPSTSFQRPFFPSLMQLAPDVTVKQASSMGCKGETMWLVFITALKCNVHFFRQDAMTSRQPSCSTGNLSRSWAL